MYTFAKSRVRSCTNLPGVHLCLYGAGELAEQHERILLSAQLRQAPPLPHRQCSVWRIITGATGQTAAQSGADLQREL